MEHAGFRAGQRVKINVEHGRLTITADERRAAMRPFLSA
ncbi:SymE family type I addiction module toxin [Caballeronia sp. LZ001]